MNRVPTYLGTFLGKVPKVTKVDCNPFISRYLPTYMHSTFLATLTLFSFYLMWAVVE